MNVIDNFIVPALKETATIHKIILLDEIGRMQAISPRFLDAVDSLLSSGADVLGTIVGDPEPWSLPFKNMAQVIVVELTPENRDQLSSLLVEVFGSRAEIELLTDEQQKYVTKLLKEYFSEHQYLQIHKLVTHAVKYVTQKRIEQVGPDHFAVSGFHDHHQISRAQNKWQCDCDLFVGRGQYAGSPGVCSHIQAVKIYSI